MRMCSILSVFWHIRGHREEARSHFVSALAHPGAQERTKERAEALNAAVEFFDPATARQMQEESLSLWRELDQRGGIARALGNLGPLAARQGDLPQARLYLEESLLLVRELGIKTWEAIQLSNLGGLILYMGDEEQAKRYLEESLSLSRSYIISIVPGILGNLGSLYKKQGDLSVAQTHFEEALSLHRQVKHPSGIAHMLCNLGELACDQRNYEEMMAFLSECLALSLSNRIYPHFIASLALFADAALAQSQHIRAVRLSGATATFGEAYNYVDGPFNQARKESRLSKLRDTLGEAAFAREWKVGGAMTMEEVLAYALNQNS